MSAGTVYDRMEVIARQGGPRFRPFRERLIEIAILSGSVFLLGYLLYAAQFSGAVRWSLGSALIAVVALYAWYAVSRETEEPPPLEQDHAPAKTRFGELAQLTAVVHRASQGLPYSQVSVSSRAREAFEEHVRLARGLTPEAMRALERDAPALRAALRDGALADFVHMASTETDERYRWVQSVAHRPGFNAALTKILDRMEAWR